MANESKETRQTRLNLIKFVKVTNDVLMQVHFQLQDRLDRNRKILARNLATLYLDIPTCIDRLTQNFNDGLNPGVVRSLKRAGLYYEALKAKLGILFDCIRDGSLESILKTLNSILGSLSSIFSAAEYIREFKEMLEVAIDRLGPEADPIEIRITLPELY